MTNPTTFADLGLEPRLLAALAAEGYATPTPVQAQTIPALLAGRDVLGVAQTGTGKTAAFALPLLQRLAAEPARPAPTAARALVLAPTRELAIQIEAACRVYGRGLGLRTAVVVGGVAKGGQVRALARGVDILVATPGRLIDLAQERRVRLDRVATLVLDEADRMLDMGFIHDVRRIAAMVAGERQSMLFSATMPPAVASLANDLLRRPVRVEVSPHAPAVARIDQRVIHVARPDKRALLARMLQDPELARVLVFTRTKHGADRLARQLAAAGVGTGALHGNKTQGARQEALARFRAGQARVLVATDIAARGLDVDGITHVVNFDLPNVPESYVHRIGRTARAGTAGVSVSFCDPSEREQLHAIERLTRQPLTIVGDGRARGERIAGNANGAGPGAGRPGGLKRRRRPRRPGARPFGGRDKAA